MTTKANSDDVPQSTTDEIKTNVCCNDANCKDNNLATANFFLPAGLRASIRRLSSVKSKPRRGTDMLPEEGSDNIDGENLCCNDGNCNGDGNRLANANFFLPAGVLPASASLSNVFTADTDRCSIVRRISVSIALDATVVKETTRHEGVVEEDEEPISSVGRSHITAKGICCAVSIHLIFVKSFLL